jgi:hypothetical protein
MSSFLWTEGHLGWGIFWLIVFTVLWGLLADLVWRMKSIRFLRFFGVMAAGWLVGAVLVVAVFWLANS